MSISIDIRNNNTQVNEVAIFRSTEVFTAENLPEAPIAVLTDNEDVYVDHNVLYGVKYYYMLRTTIGDVVMMSNLREHSNLRNTGPGPQDLIWGDNDFGFYGHVEPWELGPNSLFSPGPLNTTISNITSLYKYAIEGKTVFIPDLASTYGNGSFTTFAAVGQRNYVAMMDTGDADCTAALQEHQWNMIGIAEANRIKELVLTGTRHNFKMRLPRVYRASEAAGGLKASTSVALTAAAHHEYSVPEEEQMQYGELYRVFQSRTSMNVMLRDTWYTGTPKKYYDWIRRRTPQHINTVVDLLCTPLRVPTRGTMFHSGLNNSVSGVTGNGGGFAWGASISVTNTLHRCIPFFELVD